MLRKKLKSLIWEPMSISREFGETLNECKKIQKLLNKRKPFNFKLCLDVGHGDINSKNKNNFNPYKWLKSFIKESPVVHIKQVQKVVLDIILSQRKTILRNYRSQKSYKHY